MSNFLSTLGNIGSAFGAADTKYGDIQERKRQQELAILQRQLVQQTIQTRQTQAELEQRMQQAGGQAFAANQYAAQQPQPMPQGQPAMPPRAPLQVPQMAPGGIPGAQQMPGAGGPPQLPQQPGAPRPMGNFPTAPTPQLNVPQIPPSAKPLLDTSVPSAYDVPQLIARINSFPGTKDLPDDQKALVLEAMTKQLSPEGKAQMEILKSQQMLEKMQIQFQNKIDLMPLQFREWAEKQGIIQIGRKDLQNDREDRTDKRLDEREDRTDSRQDKSIKARTEIATGKAKTAADKDQAKKERQLLVDTRNAANREASQIKSANSGIDPAPESPDGVKLKALRDKVKMIDGNIEKMDKAALTPKQPASGGSNAPSVGDVVDGYKFKGGDPSDQASWEQVQ